MLKSVYFHSVGQPPPQLFTQFACLKIDFFTKFYFLSLKVAEVLREEENVGRPERVLILEEKLELGTYFCLSEPFIPQRNVRNCSNL